MDIHKLDPELALFLQGLPPPKTLGDIAAAREEGFRLTAEANAQRPDVEGVAIEDINIPLPDCDSTITVRIYQPEPAVNTGQLLPALLWMHGGGMMLCSIEDYSHLIAGLAKTVGCCIVSVNYRLAPEHPYPIPLEDCYTALRWLFSQSEQLHISTDLVAVGGLSAGGNLAAALALLARDRGEFSIIFQLLLCPMLDPSGNRDAYQRIYDQRLWNRELNNIGWASYLNGIDPIPVYAAPLLAKSLEKLPSTYLLVGDQDIFVDENTEYAQRLMQAGVPVELHIIPGAFHGYEFGVPDAAISQQAWQLHTSALRHAFNL